MTKEEKLRRAADNRDLTQGHITKKIILFSLPIIAGNLFQQLYNVVDSWVVGNFAENGTACLAAVNASFAIMMFFNALYMGISMGANIIVSQYKGAKDHENLQKAITTSFCLSMLAGLLITVLGVSLSRPLLELLGTPVEILDQSVTYLRIIFIGTIGNVIYNVINGLIRGMGDTKFPMYVLIIAAVLNVILDLIFVIVLHWDVAGVAWATIISHFLSGLLLLWRVNTGIYGAKIDYRHLKIDKHIFGLIMKLGLPAAIQNAAFSAGNIVNQSFSNRFGVNYIASHAIVMKADGFAMMPMMGLQAATTTYVGQNIGAGDVERTNKGIKATCWIAILASVLIGVLLYVFGDALLEAFNVNEEALHMGIRTLRFISFFYVFMGLQNVLGGALRGAGASVTSAVASVIGTFVRVPLGYFLAIHPLNKACQAAVAAGQYATPALAEAAGVGMENYVGLIYTWGLSFLVGFLILFPFYLFGHWREKGITSKAKNIKDS